MKELLVKDVLPYIQIWTGMVIVFLLWLSGNLWRFKRRHPEISEPDTTADDKLWLSQKAELRRRYNNKVMFGFVVVFLWAAGMILICSARPTAYTWSVLAVIILALFLPLSGINRRPRK